MASEQTMKLKIVSNSDEIGTHVFDNIPVGKTIGWIKRYLQTTLPSHPPADAQRILYHARFLEDDSHSHDEDVASLSFEVKEPLDAKRFQDWIGGVLQEQGADILRSKGILSYAGEKRRFAFQAV
ncbi:MAG: GTP-binding protein, partial [Terriglobus roseus]|nr:GTP-binding protein [Terriglobus roseus]